MKKRQSKSYLPEYPTWQEFNTRKFLNVATAVGIGISAASFSLDLEAEENRASESTTDKDSEVKKHKEQILLLAMNLGHDNFKERDKATKDLISLGKEFKKEKKGELIELLKSELEQCKKSKDPEVKERAKKILLAITPPPPKIPTVGIDGDIAIAGEIDF